jgi:MoaA/NifB/PqqE/SkfB family radical SAM enzyme
MCGVWTKKNDRRLPELTLEEYNDLFVQMKGLGVQLVTLVGGEPFIRSDLFDIIGAVKTHGLICNIFSNGTMIDRLKISKLFESRVDKIIISIDGIGPVHDAIRGMPGSFDRALEALSGMVAERRLRKTKRPEIDLHMTLLKKTFRACRSSMGYAANWASIFRFNRIRRPRKRRSGKPG